MDVKLLCCVVYTMFETEGKIIECFLCSGVRVYKLNWFLVFTAVDFGFKIPF